VFGRSSATCDAARSSAMAKSPGGRVIRGRLARSETSSPPTSACPGGGWYGPMENWLHIAGRSKRDAFDERAFRSTPAGVKRQSIRERGQPSPRL